MNRYFFLDGIYGIQKAKQDGKYSKERSKKLNPVMRENMMNDRKIGMSIADIIKKHHISRKSYYNYQPKTIVEYG